MSIKSKLYKISYQIIPKFVLKSGINMYIREYGKMLEYSLDNKNKQIFIKVLLAGENEPIEVSINNYKIRKTDDTTFFISNDASSNKEWINALLRNLLVGKEFSIPPDEVELIDEFLG